MHLIHALATCSDCGKRWESRNAMGVAARHHQSTGHTVVVEVAYAHRYGESRHKRSGPGEKGDRT